MPLNCNAFADTTVGATVQMVSCLSNPAELGLKELSDEQFQALVLDMLQRRASGIGTGELPEISTLLECDIAQAERNAACVMQHRQISATGVSSAKMKAVILTMLNEFLCT